jgi:hypothetical protein
MKNISTLLALSAVWLVTLSHSARAQTGLYRRRADPS